MSDSPNPELIFSTLNAFTRSSALRGAIELDLFTTVARGHRDVDGIVARCGGTHRSVRILCDFLVVGGFLEKSSDGEYSLTPTSATFLDRESPAYMGSIAKVVQSDAVTEAFSDVADLVRRGTTGLEGDGSIEPDWQGWVDFAECMTPMMAPAAEQIGAFVAERMSGPIRVLDVAAGHGLFGIAIARHNDEARVVALDWEKVLTVASRNASAAGLEDRHDLLPGDATAIDYGSDFDVVLLTNFLHHFDRDQCVEILTKARRSLSATGIVVTLEFVPNEDRVSPPFPAEFSLMMLATTPAGDAYTFRELDAMCRAAGLERNELVALEHSPQSLVVSQA